MSAFSVRTSPGQDPVLVTICGDIDIATSGTLRDHLLALPGRGTVLDMSGVELLAASGLRVLLELHGRLDRAGAPLVLAAPRTVRRIITVTGLDTTLVTVPTVGDAITLAASAVPEAAHRERGRLAETLAGIVADLALAARPVTHAGVTVTTCADRQETLWASDEVAEFLEAVQAGLGEGPCVQAFMQSRPVLVPDLAAAADTSWPAFAAAVRRTPVRGVQALPLRAGSITVGVLDLYRDTPGPLSDEERADALRVADAVYWALAGVPADDGTDLPDSAAVHRATGMVMVQAGVSVERALSRLRAVAVDEDLPIEVLARDVTAGRLRFDRDGAVVQER